MNAVIHWLPWFRPRPRRLADLPEFRAISDRETAARKANDCRALGRARQDRKALVERALRGGG